MGQYRVNTERNLNMRRAGDRSAAIVASLLPHVIVHVSDSANANGYAQAFVWGWLGTDDKTLFADSLSPNNSSVDAVILDRTTFEAQGVQDVYGRMPGLVRGWVYLPYLTAVESG